MVFAGKTLIPSLYQPHGFTPEGAFARAGRTPVNTFNVDMATPAYYEFPVNKLIGDIYRNGGLPLWNPYQAAGTPLAAQYSTRAFFPYQIIEDMSPYWTWDYFMLGRALLAGLFTFLFLRETGLSFIPSLSGGAFYMFSGAFTWFINLEQYANPAFILPLLMYSAERLAKTGRPLIEGRREAVLLAFVTALLLLAGQPEVALYALLLATAYFIFRILSIHGWSGFISRAVKFGVSFALSLALSSPLVLIFLELVRESYHIHPGGGPIGMEALLNWKALFAVLTPSATEFPADPEMVIGVSLLARTGAGYYRFLPIDGVWDTLGGYTGVLPVFLTLTGLILAFRTKGAGARAQFLFFLSSAVFIILKNTGIRPFVWLGALPLFDRVWSLRWAGPVWVFSLTAASAIGFEMVQGLVNAGVTEVTEKNGEDRVKSGVYFKAGLSDIKPGMAAFIAFILITGAYVLIPFIPSVIISLRSGEFFNPAMRPYALPSLLSSSVVTLAVLIAAFLLVFFSSRRGSFAGYPVLALSLVELWWAVPRGYDAPWLLYKWLPFLLGVAAVIALYKGRMRTAFMITALFFAAFISIDTLSPRGTPQRDDPFRPAPYLDFLKGREDWQTGRYRAMGVYGALFPNYAGAAGLNDPRFVNSLLASPYHYFRSNFLHAEKAEEATESVLWFTGRPERSVRDEYGRAAGVKYKAPEDDILKRLPGYSLLGVRYIIFPRDLSPGPDWKMPLLYDGEVRIYENTGALPGAFVVYGFERAADYMEAEDMAFGEKGDPLKTAVLEADPPVSSSASPGTYEARMRRYGANALSVEVQTDRDGMLVLTDVFYPGWRAEVNGEEREVVRVDGLFRGVAINKGRSVVVFRYSPRSFKTGLIISGFACIISLFAFITDKRDRKEKG